MGRIILACDESGAKGYADQGEAYDGEVGVFAGVMVPDSVLAQVEADFRAIQNKYRPETGKLHITDLAPNDARALRDEIYDAVRRHKLPCFWYAVHVEGFHRHYVEISAQLAKARTAAAAHPHAGRLKGGSPRENPDSLHVALFEGLYAHLVAFLEERECLDVEIEVRTDRVDNPIVEKFEEIAKKLLGDMVSEEIVKRFDTLTKTIVGKKIRIEARIPPTLAMKLCVKSLEIEAVDNDDGIVLAADVLANHLAYLFKNRDASEKYGPLNRPPAIGKHPLADYLETFRNWGGPDPIGDGLYAHPKAQA